MKRYGLLVLTAVSIMGLGGLQARADDIATLLENVKKNVDEKVTTQVAPPWCYH